MERLTRILKRCDRESRKTALARQRAPRLHVLVLWTDVIIAQGLLKCFALGIKQGGKPMLPAHDGGGGSTGGGGTGSRGLSSPLGTGNVPVVPSIPGIFPCGIPCGIIPCGDRARPSAARNGTVESESQEPCAHAGDSRYRCACHRLPQANHAACMRAHVYLTYTSHVRTCAHMHRT